MSSDAVMPLSPQSLPPPLQAMSLSDLTSNQGIFWHFRCQVYCVLQCQVIPLSYQLLPPPLQLRHCLPWPASEVFFWHFRWLKMESFAMWLYTISMNHKLEFAKNVSLKWCYMCVHSKTLDTGTTFKQINLIKWCHIRDGFCQEIYPSMHSYGWGEGVRLKHNLYNCNFFALLKFMGGQGVG